LDFIEFVFQKYRENADDFNDNEANIRTLVSDEANKFNYVFSNMEESNITFGGKRIKRKTRKIIKKLLLKKVGQNPKKTKCAKKTRKIPKRAKNTNKAKKAKKTKNAKKAKKSWKTKKNYKNY
jgi:hypothetical protein